MSVNIQFHFRGVARSSIGYIDSAMIRGEKEQKRGEYFHTSFPLPQKEGFLSVDFKPKSLTVNEAKSIHQFALRLIFSGRPGMKLFEVKLPDFKPDDYFHLVFISRYPTMEFQFKQMTEEEVRLLKSYEKEEDTFILELSSKLGDAIADGGSGSYRKGLLLAKSTQMMLTEYDDDESKAENPSLTGKILTDTTKEREMNLFLVKNGAPEDVRPKRRSNAVYTPSKLSKCSSS